MTQLTHLWTLYSLRPVTIWELAAVVVVVSAGLVVWYDLFGERGAP